MRCFRCAKEIVVPPKDDPIYDTQPLGEDNCYFFPAAVLDVSSSGLLTPATSSGPGGVSLDGCHAAVVCWNCFHEIDPDMWITPEMWDTLNPAVPFSALPALDHDADNCDEIETYRDYAPKEGR